MSKKDTSKLVPKIITVTRGGRTHRTKVWVKPDEVEVEETKAPAVEEEDYSEFSLFDHWEDETPKEEEKESKEEPKEEKKKPKSDKPIHLESFKQWFGDWEKGEGSKVIKDSGEPAENYNLPTAVFHGTAVGGFDEFNKDFSKGGLYGGGFYFTEQKNIAEEYTGKDEDKSAEMAIGLKDKDGKEVTKIPYADVKAYVENAKIDAWQLRSEKERKENPEIVEAVEKVYGKDYKYNENGSTGNPNWSPHTLSLILRSQDKNGDVDFKKFMDLAHDPNTEYFKHNFNTEGNKYITKGKDLSSSGSRFKADFIESVLGDKYEPIIPESEVFEVYLNVRNPLDLDGDMMQAESLLDEMQVEARERMREQTDRAIKSARERIESHKKYHEQEKNDADYDGGWDIGKQESSFFKRDKDGNILTVEKEDRNSGEKYQQYDHYTLAEVDKMSDKELREVTYSKEEFNDPELSHFKGLMGSFYDEKILTDWAKEKGIETHSYTREDGSTHTYVGEGAIPSTKSNILAMANLLAKSGIAGYDPETETRVKKSMPTTKDGKATLQHLAYVLSDGSGFNGGTRMNEWAKKQGHDGLAHTGGWNFTNVADGDLHKVWIAFEPNQIKKTSNVTFDAGSNKINKALNILING